MMRLRLYRYYRVDFGYGRRESWRLAAMVVRRRALRRYH